ncbi:MAG TPA: hypothetical protein VLK37_11535 [Solirubrobacterales bacterium]|nr:hypothetical protein [Solirubrobacterales bacterium]
MRFPGKSAPAATASAGSSKEGNGNTFSLGVLAAMLVCAAAFLGIGAPAAGAAPEAQPGWSLQSTFGEAQGSAFEGSQNPLAIDGNGNIFATYQESGRVNGYAPDESSLGPYGFTNEVQNLAADFGEGVLYVDNLFGGPITRWVSDGAPTPTYTAAPGFSVPGGAGLTVDTSTHDLLVADPGAEAVRRYDTTGSLVDSIATPSISPAWIAAAPDGSFYVAPDGGSDITHLSATGTVLGTTAGVGALQGLAFDPVQELLVASVGGLLKTYDASGQFLSEVNGNSAAWLGSGDNGLLYGLANGAINKYVPATVPGVESPLVTNVQPNSVHVSADVDPGAGPPEGSQAHFEYSADGGLSWTSTPDEGVERTGTDEPDTIEANLTGLTLNSDYLVRVKASNAVIPNVLSPATSFSTPEIAPVVETGSVGDRSETGAMLYGTVTPAGLQTTYHFEYGTTTAYGSRAPLEAEAPAGNRRVPRTVQRPISGLQPGTTYHYRLVAENAIGETLGDDRTFTTLKPDELFPQRAYEQVTPVDKEGAVVQSDFHVQTAADGSAIAVTSAAAADDSESALILQNYLSRRSPDGWLDWKQVDPPQDAEPNLNESATAAISDDFEHALVISNRALAPGGVSGAGNLYVKDLSTGAYTSVASAPDPNAWDLLVGIQANERIFLAAAPDFSWILFWGIPSFSPEASTTAIYRWTRASDELKVESRLPDGTVTTSPVQTADGYQREMPLASSDGSAVAFSASGVFRRENGQTTAISVSRVTGDPNDEPQPATIHGMTPDGRYVFFSSERQLTDDAPPANPAADGLYRYDATTDELLYLGPKIAGTVLGVYGFSGDGQRVYFDNGARTVVWDEGTIRQVTTDRPVAGNFLTTSVSASRRYFAWEDPDHNVHVYDAVLGESNCASCPADGSTGGDARMMAVGRGIGNRAVRAMMDNGTVFFDTPIRLLAADHNGTRDVYAYKEGRLDLISSGDEDFDATFVDASEDGSSVFFQTNQGLVGQDTDGNADVYVARLGGGFASQNPPPPPGSCQGAECAEAGGQPAGGPPVNTAAVASPATAPKKHKKHKHKHKKSKKHKHKGQGQKSKRHSPKTLGN